MLFTFLLEEEMCLGHMGIERLTSFLFQKTGLLGFRKGTYDEKKLAHSASMFLRK